MLFVGSALYLQFRPDDHHRNLQPAQVTALEGRRVTARFLRPPTERPQAGECWVYFEYAFEFMKQMVSVVSMLDDPDTLPTILLDLDNDAISAECRHHQRIPMMYAKRTAAFGPEDHCSLLDVSQSGYAVEARQHYKLGHVVIGTIRHRDLFFSGPAIVQSVQELPNGRYRYGMRCIPGRAGEHELGSGLRRIVEEVLGDDGVIQESA